MNFDMTLFALLTICAVLAIATVHNRIRDEEEDDNDAEYEEEEGEGNGRNVLDELDFVVPGRRSLARLIHSVTSTPKGDVIGDATAAHARSSYSSREVKVHNLYLWMLLDESEKGLRRSLRTKKDQVKDHIREDQLLQDHLKDHLPVRDSRRRKIAGLFKVNGSKDVSEEETGADDDCPLAVDGQRLFFCPTPDEMGRQRCIDDENLCDRKTDCPNAEDEDPTACMFHGLTRTYFRLVIETILRLIRPLSYSAVQRGPVTSSVPHRRSGRPVGATFAGYSSAQRNEGGTEDIL